MCVKIFCRFGNSSYVLLICICEEKHTTQKGNRKWMLMKPQAHVNMSLYETHIYIKHSTTSAQESVCH